MEDRLMEAAQVGDIDALYQLIWEGDGDILKRIDEKMFADTPLHLAAASGQTHFAMEVSNLMPSFLRKLNKSGFSPMHLALMNGHSDLVCLFLHADPGLVRLKGRGGLTPLHYAAKYGNADLLSYFLVACPESIEDVTVQGKTVFHIAAETDTKSADVLEILVGWLRRVCHKHAFYWAENLPNWKDQQGKTVLDIIEHSTSISQIVKVLGLLLEINAKNSKGERVLEVLQRQTKLDRRILVKMISRRHWHNTHDHLNNNNGLIGLLRSEMGFEEAFVVYVRRHKMRLSHEVVNALLVVAGLILAAIFPYVYNPPGGFRPVSDNQSTAFSLNYNGTLNSTLHVNITSNPTTNSTGADHQRQRVAMNEGSFALVTLVADSLFCVVLSIISFLLPDGLFGTILLWLLMGFLVLYYITINVISVKITDVATVFIYVLFPLTSLTIFCYAIGRCEVARLEAHKYRLIKAISSKYSGDADVAAGAPAGACAEDEENVQSLVVQ